MPGKFPPQALSRWELAIFGLLFRSMAFLSENVRAAVVLASAIDKHGSICR
jgi:hypothetical protein